MAARSSRRGQVEGVSSAQLAEEIWRLRTDNPAAYRAVRAVLRALVEK